MTSWGMPAGGPGAQGRERGGGSSSVGEEEDEDADDDLVGDAGGGAGDPGEVEALGFVERDRALVREDERGAGEDAADGERGDEGGDLELDVGEAGQRPGDGTGEDGEEEGGVAEAADGERHDDAGERGHGLDREVDPAQHDDEGDAGGEDEEGGGVAAELEEGGGGQELRLERAHDRDQGDERHDRHPPTQQVAVEAGGEGGGQGRQPMCSMRATWSGLPPAGASKR